MEQVAYIYSVCSKSKKNQYMTDISRIKTALEFLKENQGFKVGGLNLSCKDNIVYVSGSTNYNDLININKSN